jgi:methionyl-tRNA formyltransferase
MIEDGTAPRIPQDPAKASYFGRRRPEDGRIDWLRSARECWNLVRAVTHPYPGAFTHIDRRKLYVWQASPLDLAPDRVRSEGMVPPGSEASEPSGSGRGRGTEPSAITSLGKDRTMGHEAQRDTAPGTIVSIEPGRGLVVATGRGLLLVERVQFEGEEEACADDLAGKTLLEPGRRLEG